MMPEHAAPRCFYCGIAIEGAPQRWTLHGASGQSITVHGGCLMHLAQAFAVDGADLTQPEQRLIFN